MVRYVLTIEDHLAKIDFGKTKDTAKCCNPDHLVILSKRK